MPPPLPFVYTERVLQRALTLSSGQLMPVSMRSVGKVDTPKLEVSIWESATRAEQEEVIDRITWVLNLDEDLTMLYALMDKDPILRQITDKLYGLRPWVTPTVFEGIVNSIISQEISLKAAVAMVNALVEKFGEKIRVNDRTFLEFPLPEMLARTTIEELRNCKLSRNKAKYIHIISQAIVDGELSPEKLKELSKERVIEELTAFDGLCMWTTETVLVTSLRRWEVFPADDLGVRKGISRYYHGGKLISGKEARLFGEKCGDNRGLITFYMLSSLH